MNLVEGFFRARTLTCSHGWEETEEGQEMGHQFVCNHDHFVLRFGGLKQIIEKNDKTSPILQIFVSCYDFQRVKLKLIRLFENNDEKNIFRNVVGMAEKAGCATCYSFLSITSRKMPPKRKAAISRSSSPFPGESSDEDGVGQMKGGRRSQYVDKRAYKTAFGGKPRNMSFNKRKASRWAKEEYTPDGTSCVFVRWVKVVEEHRS